VRQGGLIAKLQNAERTTEIRAPISGRIRTLSVATGSTVAAGAEIATIDPGSEQVWEALRALYLVGEPDDLAAIRIYQRNVPEIPDRLRQQALLTEKAIQARATK
jgi:multidrug efflux pump subunit AcrA (membrane-fusion protein)